jgi:predicted nuclease of predicted toxin-antitoxin system
MPTFFAGCSAGAPTWISSAQNVGLSATPDPEILAWAAAEGRILLTHDRDTMPNFANERVRAGQPMPGVFLVSNRMPLGQAIDELLLAIACLSLEECKDCVRFFPL